MTDEPAGYREPPRSYVSTVVLFALILLGFVADIAIGGARAHWVGWLGAAVLVCGIDALTAHAARSARTILVTAQELRVGESVLDRSSLAERIPPDETTMPVFARLPGSGLPRGVTGLGIRTADGAELIVASRKPDQLAAALGLVTGRAEVRTARPDELTLLPELESRSGTLFRVAGLELPDEAMSVTQLEAANEVLVIGEPPVGFATLTVVDGHAHLAQLSVLPGSMRQGLGSRLIESCCEWAGEHGHTSLTLTTFAEVSFNGPFYAKRGFQVLTEPGPELAAIRAAEREAGLDEISPRCAMSRRLGGV